MNSYLPYILLIIGFWILIKGADILVDGASSIARKLDISDLVIGLTMVSFGTSAPELFVNLIAIVKGNTGIAIGNIVGSNIANILLILGISAVIYPLAINKGTIWREIPFSLFASVLLFFLANDSLIFKGALSFLSRIDGFIFCAFFAVFVYYTFTISKDKDNVISVNSGEKQFGTMKSIFMIIGGILLLSIAGKWIVDGAVKIAYEFDISETMIGLTIVAVGTSLPELAASAVAAYKKKPELAVGNVVGSCIFNIFLVLGLCSVIKPIPFQQGNNRDVSVMIFASLMLFIFMFTGKRRLLDRWKGAVFVVLYILYIVYLVFRADVI